LPTCKNKWQVNSVETYYIVAVFLCILILSHYVASCEPKTIQSVTKGS